MAHGRKRSAPHTVVAFGRAAWRRYRVLYIGILLVGLAGCGAASVSEAPLPLPTLMPTVPIAPPPPPATLNLPTGEPGDTGWVATEPGVELRRLRVMRGERLALVSMVRLDPAYVQFQVGYAPDQPRPLATWHSRADAVATINGGFFDMYNRSTALIIRSGVASGVSYQGSGGMFAVDKDGRVSLRYLADEPYDLHEPLLEALQSWPMLIKSGGTLVYTGADDGQRARRSVVALDRQGRVLLLAFASNTFTLRGLADWLLASDLDLDAALNLDGGSSTGLYADSGGEQLRIDAFVLLPITLMVHRR